MDSLVCNMCLNPSYKDGLCVEHNTDGFYSDSKEGFVIRGDMEYFYNVQAFKVFGVEGSPCENEIRLGGHIYYDYLRMKGLLNLHFKKCRLIYFLFWDVTTIPRLDDLEKAIQFYELLDAEMKLYREDGELKGILVGVLDRDYMNLNDWNDAIRLRIQKTKKQIDKILKYYDAEIASGLVW